VNPPAPATGPVAVVLGTRPEIIKLGHLIRLLGDAATVIHTGQHFDLELSEVFFEAFGIPVPTTTLGVGGSSRGAQIGGAVTALDAAFAAHRPSVVVVQGDTNSAAAGALAANAAEVPLVHVESGLRSHDRRMPEEHNRIIADHLADLCCAPTEVNHQNLLGEDIPESRIRLTGNTIVEAVTGLIPPKGDRARTLAKRGLESGRFVLTTFHRPENVDDPDTLLRILEQLAAVPLPVVLPLHPRTRQNIAASEALTRAAAALITCEPLGYAEFLGLAAESALLISDSGGVQEEASIIKRPVIVVRRSTERPEVLGTFATLVEPGADFAALAASWLQDLPERHATLAALPSPYGDGTASAQIAAAVREIADA
jgi:UDP-N-acetylglucosamine 2-epimerase (non-hydrolysing)